MSERLEKAKAKRAERATLIEQNNTLLAKAKTEKRDPTKEESSEWDKRDAAIEALKVEYEEIEAAIDRESRQDAHNREMASSRGLLAAGRDQRVDTQDPEERAAKQERMRKTAFNVFALRGIEALTEEERKILVPTSIRLDGQDLPADLDPRLRGTIQQGISYRLNPTLPELTMRGYRGGARPEYRANEPQASTNNGFGGYTVPNAPMGALDEALLQFGGMRQANTNKIRTDSGADLPIPANDDTANKGAILAENTQLTGATPLAFTQSWLRAYMYTSGFILCSFQFLQDTSIDAETYVMRKAGERLGRIFNDHDTKGSNVAQPYGVAWAATLGKTAASATAITFGELIDTIHSVDPAYRGGAQLMMHDLTLAAIKKLTDSQNRPVFLPGIAAREPDSINGYPYIINQSMDSLAAGKHSVLFGDFSHYWIRDVREIVVLRLVERFADYLQVGFLAFARHDATLVDAGTHPIKYLRHPAS